MAERFQLRENTFGTPRGVFPRAPLPCGRTAVSRGRGTASTWLGDSRGDAGTNFASRRFIFFLLQLRRPLIGRRRLLHQISQFGAFHDLALFVRAERR